MSKRFCIVLLAFALALPVFCETPERAGLIGVWTGKSICTDVAPACHDEEALYRVASVPGDDNTVQISMGKVVKGQEIVMGVTPFKVDWKRRVLSSEYTYNGNHLLWTFAWSGGHMTGTLKRPPKNEIVRNIDLRKQ